MIRSLVRALPSPARRIVKLFRPRDIAASTRFIVEKRSGLSVKDKLLLLWKINIISLRVDCPHTQDEALTFIRHILSSTSDEGCIVEAGCYKGGSTAKFSLAAALAGKRLYVFDSFQGIPRNSEPHDYNIFGGTASFSEGDWCGTIDEVKNNVQKFGSMETCVFVVGWFHDTMPRFAGRIAAAYVDVDLVASTRTCLANLFPLMNPRGVLCSQDGHLPLVISLLKDERFWLNEVGFSMPKIEGLGKRKLLQISKPEAPAATTNNTPSSAALAYH